MDRHEKAAKIAELSKTIKESEAELDALLGGAEVKIRAPQKCSKCGAEGHTARTCSTADPPRIPLQAQS